MAQQNESDIGMWEFLIPDIRRMKQARSFDSTIKNISQNIGQDFDNRGQPVEGPQQPGMVQPTEFNVGQLSTAKQFLDSGNTDLQQQGLKMVQGMQGEDRASNEVASAMTQGKGLDDQLALLAMQGGPMAEMAMKERTKRANSNTPGMVGQYEAAKAGKYIPETMSYQEFVKLVSQQQAAGKAAGDTTDGTNNKKKMDELKAMGVPNDVAQAAAYPGLIVESQDNMGRQILIDMREQPPAVIGRFEAKYGQGTKFVPNPDYKKKPFESPWGKDLKKEGAGKQGGGAKTIKFGDLPK